ncbi:hypothetical protein O181_004552 [Austropuccinia psidii MF-1]|uniref:Uncharacterized protein n=1 Tax=Austropuccinia psidii MF-1 TaxID=1389203 RepID=A0A9Q3BH09_9BASI|nr:hypothetical protein [Austropuccinia psidii MF-1]
MPLQHLAPARKTKYQARAQAALTPTPRAPLDGTPAVSQLKAQLDGGPNLEGAAPSREEGPGEDDEEGRRILCTGGPTLAQTNKPVPNQSEPSLLAIMQKMTQIMDDIQAASSSEASRLHL